MPASVRLLRRAVRRALLGWPRDFVIDYAPQGGVCAEVGVWRGDFSSRILDRAHPSVLHLIDPWAYLPEFDARRFGGGKVPSQEEMDRIYADVQRRFQGCERVRIHRVFSRECDLLFRPDSFDWVYLDGNHEYDYVVADLHVFYQKVKPGGILAGDDYDWGEAWGHPVRRAVHDFVRAFPVDVLEVRASQFVLQKP